MRSDTGKLSIGEKIGYSLGDLAANLIFQTLVTFLAFFYTDVYRIPASAAASIIFVVGLVGAFVFTPLVGIAADRTRSRWGKFRPWIAWTAIPFGVLALAAFSTPALGEHGKIVYALASYLLLMLVYVANNLPYAALSGVLTGSMAERNSLSSYRFVAVMLAQFVIQVLLLPLVMALGDGDKARGFEHAMALFAAIGTVFFLVTFFSTRERIVPRPEQRSTVAQDLADLARNGPWRVMLALTVLVFVTLALKGGMYVYYFKYYLDQQALAGFIAQVGFGHADDPATSAFSLFSAAGIVFMIAGIACSKRLADRFGKRDVFAGAMLLATLCLLAFWLYSPQAVWAVVLTYLLHGFFYGITTPLLWAMIADVADYSEWKTGRRATAIIFSAMLCGLKLGLSIGGALVAAILAGYGYDAAAPVQAAAVAHGIRLSVSVYSALPFLAGIGLLFLYRIDRRTERRIEQELGARRALT